MSDYHGEAVRHGGLGIAAFIVGLVAAFILFGAFAVAGYIAVIHAAGPAANAAIGMVIFFGWFVGLIAVGLGIGGLFDKTSKKIFPIFGLAVAGSSIIFSAGLIAYQLAKNQMH